MRVFFLLGVLAVFISLLLPYLVPLISDFAFDSVKTEDELDRLPPTLQALNVWNNLLEQKTINHSIIAVGYNANLDLIVRALDLFEALKLSPENAAAKNLRKISTRDDLKSVFVNYFSQGSAVERFIDNEELCQELMTAATSLNEHEFSIGGNAALIAQYFANQNFTVLLGGAVGDKLSSLLSKNIRSVISNNNVKEEIHLIMEYERGSRWGGVTAPRSNRMIVHCDKTNSRLQFLEEFHQKIHKENVSLVVLSGLHLLESEPPNIRTERLMKLKSYLSSTSQQSEKIPSHIPVHLELASIADLRFLAEIGRTIIPHVNSLGLNEQELGSLFVALGGKESDLGKRETTTNDDIIIEKYFKDPSLSVSLAALGNLFIRIPFTAGHSLSRIHFHCLKYHIVARRLPPPPTPSTRYKSDNFFFWDDAKISAAAGALTATLNACNYRNVSVARANETEFLLVTSLSPVDYCAVKKDDDLASKVFYTGKQPFIHLDDKRNQLAFWIVPLVSCKRPSKTVGLGDAISASGLLYHTLQAIET
jgi:ADP-dependent glucokinase